MNSFESKIMGTLGGIAFVIMIIMAIDAVPNMVKFGDAYLCEKNPNCKITFGYGK